MVSILLVGVDFLAGYGTALVAVRLSRERSAAVARHIIQHISARFPTRTTFKSAKKKDGEHLHEPRARLPGQLDGVAGRQRLGDHVDGAVAGCRRHYATGRPPLIGRRARQQSVPCCSCLRFHHLQFIFRPEKCVRHYSHEPTCCPVHDSTSVRCWCWRNSGHRAVRVAVVLAAIPAPDGVLLADGAVARLVSHAASQHARGAASDRACRRLCLRHLQPAVLGHAPRPPRRRLPLPHPPPPASHQQPFPQTVQLLVFGERHPDAVLPSTNGDAAVLAAVLAGKGSCPHSQRTLPADGASAPPKGEAQANDAAGPLSQDHCPSHCSLLVRSCCYFHWVECSLDIVQYRSLGAGDNCCSDGDMQLQDYWPLRKIHQTTSESIAGRFTLQQHTDYILVSRPGHSLRTAIGTLE